jgi:hypothetical protein
MKIPPLIAELFYADERTDRQDIMKLTLAFCNLVIAPKK